MFPWNTAFPFQKDAKEGTDSMKKMNPNDIQSFISQLFSQVMPGNMQQMMNQDQSSPFQQTKETDKEPTKDQANDSPAPLQAKVFETHSDVFVRIPIKDETWINKMKLYHTSNQSIIEGIPEPEDRHVITLPGIVKKKGATAQYKDDTLEIRLPKHIDFQYSEINVTEL